MKRIVLSFFTIFSLISFGQQICNPSGNLAIYSNYDGGIMTINVDQNIPNLIIGICTYEPVQVNLIGPFVGNVTQVVYAGMNSNQNNDNCNLGNFSTSVTGVSAGIVTINPPMSPPQVGFTPEHGNGTEQWGGFVLGANGSCDTLNPTNGVNTPDEIVYYFQQLTGGTLLLHDTQSGCWINNTFDISLSGNCCIAPALPPVGCGLLASVSVQQNSVCEPCFYSGPPILINELMISPSSNDGSISGNGGVSQGRGEWIELYNPDLCDSVDISCYYLGNNTPEGSGGFRLPQGTIIPPNGYCMVRGINVDPVPSNLLVQNGGNVVEIIVPGEINQTGICCNGTRVWFPNAGGWFAFYDASGNPVDAVRWGPGNTASLAGQPCISSQVGCSNSTSLSSYNSIPDDLKFYASSADGSSHFGQTIRRFPDGGSWSGIGQPTYAICNDPLNCLTGSVIGFCNGSGTVNITTGVPPFTFQWNDDLNQTTQTATNLCEGSYEVVVTDANNCQESYTINVITNPFNLTTNIQQPACQQNNGSISIEPFDPSYSYSWSPAVSANNTASNLPQGIYTISIQQGFCSLDTTIILQNPVPFTTTAQSIQTTCGLDNGSIIISNFPSGTYIYSWTPNVSSTNIGSSLTPGNYQISITDNICVFDTVISIQPSVGLSSNAVIYNSTCQQSNGAVVMDISPVGVYTFTWPTNTSFIADSAFNLVEGSYFVSFTDGICTGDTTVIVSTTSPPVDIISNVTATQCDENTGFIEIANTSGGNPPYTFTIDNGLFTPSIFFDSLGQGTYTISVLDANNCVYEEQIQVPQFAGPSLIQVEFNNPNCGLNNGSLLINGTIGGNGPFVYTFNNLISNTLDTIQNIGVGSYNLTVVDANGCAHNQLENFVMTAGDYSIRIPNVLTANSDQTNDLWTITTKCVESIDCIILNRWGDRIYEFYEIDGGWDGKTSSGNEVVPGVYFYKLVANYFGGASEEFHGHITLIRN